MCVFWIPGAAALTSLSSGFSSIPDWVQSTRYEPYHFIQIGIAKTKKELPSSKVCKEEFSVQSLNKVRVQSLQTISQKLQEINEESSIKVNYCSITCIMVSKFQKKTSTEDLKLVGIFESNLVNIEQLACGDQTKKEWCRIVRRTYQKHLCLYCKDKADSSSTSGEQNNVEKSCPDSPLTNAYDERSDDHKRIPSI